MTQRADQASASRRGGSLTWLALRAGIALARRLPPRFVIKVAAIVGRLAGHVSPRRTIVKRNLEVIRAWSGAVDSGDPGDRRDSRSDLRREAVRPADVFGAYGRYWGEFLVFSARPGWFDGRLRRIEGEEHLRRAARMGPVCALTGHLGNWDLCARFTRRLLPRMAVVAERLEPPALYRLFREARERDGGRVIAADRAGLVLSRLWRSGGHAGLVADRVFGRGERSVPFLGDRMPLPSSGVDLAVRAGATLVPVFLVREEDGYVLRVHPPLAPGEDPLPGFARALERELARHAAQWCFLYPAREPHPVESALDPMTGAAGPRADRASASTTELTSMPEACA